MGCGRKSEALSMEAEADWRNGLTPSLEKLNSMTEAVELLGEEMSLTRDQFKMFEDAVKLLNEITGKKRFW